VPAAGTLAATATGRPPAKGKRKKKPLRTVARKGAKATGPGSVVVRLRLAKRYRPLLRHGRVKARTKVVFAPADGTKPLTRSVSVTFALQRSHKK
jgi:hypothetical protein